MKKAKSIEIRLFFTFSMDAFDFTLYNYKYKIKKGRKAMKQTNQALTKDIEKVDVTKEMKEKCFRKTKGYEGTLGKVEKEGSLYIITFAEGYTAFCQKQRKARKVTEVIWYSKIAKEEKEQKKKLEDYIEEFKKNGILFDGKTIPEFIDTKESFRARKKAEEKLTQNHTKKSL